MLNTKFQSSNKFILYWSAFLILASLTLALNSGLYGVQHSVSHAIERHGSDAVRVNECLDRDGAKEVWYNPETGRYAEICNLSVEEWGIRISEKIRGWFEERTAFIEQGDYTALERYLFNRGYMSIYPILILAITWALKLVFRKA